MLALFWRRTDHSMNVAIHLIGGLASVALCGCGLFAAPASLPVNSVLFRGDSVAREIEDADIVKLRDGFLYVANPFTGLRIIDIRAIDQPRLMGRVALGGRGVELFVRDDTAFVLTAADSLNCAGERIGFQESIFDPQVVPDYTDSRLWVIDVSNPAVPQIMSTLDFDGFVTATRRVGDVIFAAGNLARISADDTGDSIFDGGAFVTSIGIADPERTSIVETETFPGRSLDVHVTGEAMYVFGSDSNVFETSIVSYIDISDPDGHIALRDQIRVPGTVPSRLYVDAHAGTFRLITEEVIPSVFARVVALYVFDATDPDNIARLARLPIVVDGRLRAVRFDGDRAFAESSSGESPLLVLDLSDPSMPVIAGSLEAPGFGTHLVPLGDRLLAVGFDTTAGVRPTLILYDVADPARPRVTSRVIVGDEFAFGTRSTATVDEKALRVIEDAGLVLLPFSTFDRETGLFSDAFRFVALSGSSLVERGAVDHVGFVRRADLFDDRVWILSDQSFQAVDIDDLDAPRSLAALELIGEQELLDGGLSGCANAARARATRLTGVSPCGVFGMLSLCGTILGGVTLRLGSTMTPRRRA